MIAYKLLRVRNNGTLGPLFINRRQVLPIGKWLRAENHPTRGFAVRAGWHASHAPVAPHLSTRGRAWYRVELWEVDRFPRPEAQGGMWYIAQRMKILDKVAA